MKTIWYCEDCICKMVVQIDDHERLVIKRVPRNGTECQNCYAPANYPLNLHDDESKRLMIQLQNESKNTESNKSAGENNE